MYGFKFKGEHSSKYSVYFKSTNRTILPPVRKSSYIIPQRNGDLTNIISVYDTRTISIQVFVSQTNLLKLREKLRDIAFWLQGHGELVFDDEPDKIYDARIEESLDLSQVAYSGEFIVNFICQPFAYKRAENKSVYLGSNKINYSGTAETPCIIILENNTNEVIKNITITVLKRKVR